MDKKTLVKLGLGAAALALPLFLTAFSVLVFAGLVKNIRIRKVATVSGLEAFGEDD